MKRCPECEFIYEEEQTYCDMDGTKLIHDSQLLQSISAEPAAVAKPSVWRNRLLIAVPMAAVVVMAFLALRTAMPSRMSATPTPVDVNASQSNTGSTEQSASTSSDESSNQSARQEESGTTDPSETEASGNSDDKDEAKQRSRTTTTTTTPTVAPSSRRPETTSQPVRSDKPATASSRTQPPPAKPTPTPAPKKESRIGSIFSKTKRILKKPFKL